MKKILALLLALVLAVSLAACSKGKPGDETTTDAGTTEPTTVNTAAEIKLPTEQVTNAQGDVLITMPSSFYDEENPPTDELTDEQKEEGIKEAIVNDDGTLTYVVDKDKYDALKTKMYNDIGTSLANYPQVRSFVKNVACNGDFSVINLQVDSEEYSTGMGNFVIAWEAGLYGEMYQVFAGVAPENLSVDVVVTDYETGETIDKSHYPEAN